ncbi:MAG: hypothetical protein AAFQ13_03530 [Pseudomonadota bacterium]
MRALGRLGVSSLLSLFVALLCLLLPTSLAAESPGKDGDVTIVGTQVVNEYGRLSSNTAAGSMQVSVDGLALNLPSLEAGDLIMVYEAQGANIRGSDNARYGEVRNLNSAGRYEFHTVKQITGNTIILHDFGGACSGLTFSYTTAGKAQVIRVPQFRNLTVSGGSRIVARAWDGQVGGIVAMTVENTLVVSGAIDASGQGFRGGQVDNLTVPTGSSYFGYRSNDASDGAEKGESIAGYQSELPGGRFYGRGAPANGGGGGNGHNAGGGGGANGNNGNVWEGQGVPDVSNPSWIQAWNIDGTLDANTNNSGGGRGGYTFSFQDQNALVVPPGDSRWRNDFRRELGGLGGRPLDFDGTGRLFFGGGGGAGDGNNNAAGAGGAGGGLIFISAGSITGGGQILSNGSDGEDTSPRHNDGPGGGGAGGTIVLQSAGTISAQIEADGGDGGTQFITNNESEGPGGGGGGGVIATSGGASATFARGGVNGITTSASLTEFVPNGATQGATGQPSLSAPSLAATPFCRAPDAPVLITKTSRSTATTGDERMRIPGSDQTYTIAFSNPGAAIDTNSVVITDFVPSEVEVWTGAFDGTVSSPVAFVDGAGTAATGLQCCQNAGITYSDADTGNDFSYTPNGSYDPQVRRVRIRPVGSVPEGYDNARTFELFIRMRVRE